MNAAMVAPVADLPISQPDAMAIVAAHCSRFFLGFSTGHCGTTTLSARDSYVETRSTPAANASSADVHFFFEIDGRPPPRELSVAEQHIHARAGWARAAAHQILRLQQRRSGTCVDLGHTWLPTHRGLPDVLRSEGVQVTLVRIRRNAHEVARSIASDMTQQHEFGPEKLHACGDALRLVFCPKRMRASGVLCVNSTLEGPWERWSAYQKGLWLVDEAEAQWQTHHASNYRRQTSEMLEVGWGYSWGDGDEADASDVDMWTTPIMRALIPIARRLGLAPTTQPARTREHVPRAKLTSKVEAAWLLEWRHQLAAYSEFMRSACPAYTSMALPSHEARVHV